MRFSAIQRLTLVDYPGRVACIAFTPGCDLRCGFCYNSEFVLPEKLAKIRPTFIPEYAFLRFLQTRRGILDAVVVCGGEPTIHADLPDFLARVRELGFLVKLDTNGGNPAMLEHILSQGLADSVAMDVKFPLARYKELAKSRVPQDAYERSIRLLIDSKIDYEFRTTVMQPWHDTESIRAIARSISGARRYSLQNFMAGDTLDPSFEARACSPEELRELQAVASEFVPCIIR